MHLRLLCPTFATPALPLPMPPRAAHGGAIALDEAQDGHLKLIITNTTIRNNKASVSGGGLDLTCGTTSLSSTRIIGNQAQLGGGVAFQCFSAINSTSERLNVAPDCLIAENRAVSNEHCLLVMGVPKGHLSADDKPAFLMATSMSRIDWLTTIDHHRHTQSPPPPCGACPMLPDHSQIYNGGGIWGELE